MYDVNLYGLITPEQYTDIINTIINDRLKPSRSGRFDGVLLAAGPLIVPLAWWGVRHRNQTKRRRKRLLKRAIAEFNEQNPTLYMRWNRRPESSLTIERKTAPPIQEQSPTSHVMVEAQFVSDIIAPTQPVQQPAQPATTTTSSAPAATSGIGGGLV